MSKVTTQLNGSAVPSGLLGFYSNSRKKNAELGITGILSYKKGYYFQLIEGESVNVENLFAKIKSDIRHEDILTLFDSEVSKRTFPSWSMKLLDTTKKNHELLDFLNDNSDKIALLSPAKQKMLKFFYNIDNLTEPTAESYNGRQLKLLEWPDFMVVKQSPDIIELSARLIKEPCDYQDLLSSGDFGTQQQLDKILRKFESLGIMETVGLSGEVQSSNVNEVKKTSKFYSKMKVFLGLNK